MKIKLFHYTCMNHLPRIEREGINQGDVGTSQTGGFNAACFTSDENRARQGWSEGSTFDKLQVRIDVWFDREDPNLRTWSQIREEYQVSRKWEAALKKSGSNLNKWFFYFGNVPPERFEQIHTYAKREGLHPIAVIRNGVYQIEHLPFE